MVRSWSLVGMHDMHHMVPGRKSMIWWLVWISLFPWGSGVLTVPNRLQSKGPASFRWLWFGSKDAGDVGAEDMSVKQNEESLMEIFQALS